MRFHRLEIEGVHLIEGQPFTDERGAFSRIYCERELAAQGIPAKLAQASLSYNYARHTLRGFHYQLKPFEENKVVTPITGRLFDVIIDLRPESKTFLKTLTLELDAGLYQALNVPAGCANAWMTLREGTIVHYAMSEFFAPEAYRGIRYNDPLLKNIKWPASPAVISKKDLSYPDFDPATVK